MSLLGLLGERRRFREGRRGDDDGLSGVSNDLGRDPSATRERACRGEASFSQPRALVRVSSRPKVWAFPALSPAPPKSALREPTKLPNINLSEGVGGHSRRRLPSPASESSFERRMGKRKNRSKAMLRAAKRRGHVAGKSAAAADGAGASPSPTRRIA